MHHKTVLFLILTYGHASWVMLVTERIEPKCKHQRCGFYEKFTTLWNSRQSV